MNSKSCAFVAVLVAALSMPIAAAEPVSGASTSVEMEAAEFRMYLDDWSKDVAAILGAAASDRYARDRLTAAMRRLGPEGETFASQVQHDLERIDARNTRVLKKIIKRRGWAAIFEMDERIASQAGSIVVHSPDTTFQVETLRSYEALMRDGKGPPPHNYATLFDDVAQRQGRPQRFGTNVECVGGRYLPSDLEDPDKVDERRGSVGLAPIAEYVVQIEQQYGPCRP